MENNDIKNKVQNYLQASNDDIEEIIQFIIDRKREQLGVDFECDPLEVSETGGCVMYQEDGNLKVKIGWEELYTIKLYKMAKANGVEVEDDEIEYSKEKDYFIETLLTAFHELRHLYQYTTDRTDEPNIESQREIAINQVFSGFLTENYEQSISEFDARKVSLIETVEFLKEMECDITPDEVFQVFRDYELTQLDYTKADYTIEQYGNNYESAMFFINSKKEGITEIRGIDKIIDMYMSEKDKEALFSQYSDLYEEYKRENDVEKKLELLKEITLKIRPQISMKLPLVNEELNQNRKNERLMNDYASAGIMESDVQKVYNTIVDAKNKDKNMEERDSDTQIE